MSYEPDSSLGIGLAVPVVVRAFRAGVFFTSVHRGGAVRPWRGDDGASIRGPLLQVGRAIHDRPPGLRVELAWADGRLLANHKRSDGE